ncbi:MAG TPA: metalloregulator ArsR/SmtB family transcription factor [Steroidobacteraceae bacterium]
MQAACDDLFTALADPTRRRLFERLVREGEQTVHALTAIAGVSQPMVSKHLAVLKTANLVCGRRQGRETHFSALPHSLLPLIEWAVCAQ